MDNKSISIIIPTKQRLDALIVLINSIKIQKNVKIKQLIIVDQSNENNEKIIKKSLEDYEIELVYIHNTKITGLTQARNTGIKYVTGDYVFMFDDDLELFDNFIEVMVEKMNKYPDLFGLCGLQHLKKEKSKLYLLIRNFTRLGAFNINFPKKIRHKYKDDNIVLMRKISGGITVYRKEVFDKFLFDENLIKYSLGEDYDFSFRVSQEHYLGKCSDAVAYHHHNTSGRLNLRKTFDARVCFFSYFYNKNIKNGKYKFKWLSYVLLMTGIFMNALVLSLLKVNLAALKGYFSGIKRAKNGYLDADCILLKGNG